MLLKILTSCKPTAKVLKAFAALDKGLERGDFKFVQLFYNYYAGKPRETKDVTLISEQPIFDISDLEEI